MPRILQLLPLPTGDRVLDLIPRLRAALAGSGPVLLPVPSPTKPKPPGRHSLAASPARRPPQVIW